MAPSQEEIIDLTLSDGGEGDYRPAQRPPKRQRLAAGFALADYALDDVVLVEGEELRLQEQKQQQQAQPEQLDEDLAVIGNHGTGECGCVAAAVVAVAPACSPTGRLCSTSCGVRKGCTGIAQMVGCGELALRGWEGPRLPSSTQR